MYRLVVSAGVVVAALPLTACLGPTGQDGPTTSTRTSGAPSTAARGRSAAELDDDLAKIPGVVSVRLKEVDGFDLGHYDSAELEVKTKDKAAAVKVVDAAMAILWQGDPERPKRAMAYVKDSQGTLELANENDVEPDLYGARWKQAMTKRYGAWPGRGVPPS